MDIQKLLESNLFDLICFIFGIIIGFIFIFLIYILIMFINKKTNQKKKSKQNKDIYNIDPSDIINNSVTKYHTNSDNKIISVKLKNTKDICFSLIEDIARNYYPKSNNPLGEISIKDSIELLKIIEDKISDLAKSILENKAIKTLYLGARTSYNVLNFFRKKEERISEKSLEDIKITTILQVLDNNKVKQNDKEDAPFFLINNYINKKAEQLIREIGELANKTYSKGLYLYDSNDK